MDQKRTPLTEALTSYIERHPAYFCVPAHRFEGGISPALLKSFGPGVFRYDLTEADGLDNLHRPEGPILESEKLAAELFGSEECLFLVNGTSSGNTTMILSTVGEGEEILVPANVHKSVINALILSGARPVIMSPDYDEKWGIYTRLSPETVERSIAAHPDARAVFLVSPTYEGMVSDTNAIAGICHSHGIPLLVDEAHGSHFYFSDRLPVGAVAAGADLVSQSLHKTGGSMTQSSLLHRQGSLVDPARVRQCMSLMTSTSPSYVLMTSLDTARAELASKGSDMMEKAIDLAQGARKALSRLPGVRLLENDDLCRLVISAADAGIGGHELQEYLFNYENISLEMSDEKNVTCVVTWGNTEEDLERLVRGVERAIHVLNGDGCGKEKGGELPEGPSMEIFHREAAPMTPRQAFYAASEELPSRLCAGHISADMIVTYPPGIPVVWPGELIPEEIAKRERGSLRVVRQ